MRSIKILLIEPFYTGSHKKWADALKQYSSHQMDLLTLPGRFWKWRMHGAALWFSKAIVNSQQRYDVILASSMIDLALLKALLPPGIYGKLALYFHENQLTYPRQEGDEDRQKGRDRHYSWINYSSACVADAIFWNSLFHLRAFVEAIPAFLNAFPDFIVDESEAIQKKSTVLNVGLELDELRGHQPPLRQGKALLLWNHRWEYDKNPQHFFHALFELKRRGIFFELAVLGGHHSKHPEVFDQARDELNEEIVQWGYVDSRAEYIQWLLRADILPVTAEQEFFGISVMEAVAANTIPLLPRRLVYPEHFSEPWQQRQFFYDNHEHFIDKLQRFIMDVRLLRSQKTDFLAARYDWKKLIIYYDQILFDTSVKA